MILFALSTVAFAEPAASGSGAVRVVGGGGVSGLPGIGAAGRFGLEGEVWVLPRVGVGGRASGGIDGLDEGRLGVAVEAMLPLRVFGGEELSFVLAPGIGVIDRFRYTAAVSPQTDAVDVDADTTPIGFGSSASLTAELYGRMGILSMTLGPRLETYAFRTASATLQLGLGLGW